VGVPIFSALLDYEWLLFKLIHSPSLTHLPTSASMTLTSGSKYIQNNIRSSSHFQRQLIHNHLPTDQSPRDTRSRTISHLTWIIRIRSNYLVGNSKTSLPFLKRFVTARCISLATRSGAREVRTSRRERHIHRQTSFRRFCSLLRRTGRDLCLRGPTWLGLRVLNVVLFCDGGESGSGAGSPFCTTSTLHVCPGTCNPIQTIKSTLPPQT
jgi:hypothetical protein